MHYIYATIKNKLNIVGSKNRQRCFVSLSVASSYAEAAMKRSFEAALDGEQQEKPLVATSTSKKNGSQNVTAATLATQVNKYGNLALEFRRYVPFRVLALADVYFALYENATEDGYKACLRSVAVKNYSKMMSLEEIERLIAEQCDLSTTYGYWKTLRDNTSNVNNTIKSNYKWKCDLQFDSRGQCVITNKEAMPVTASCMMWSQFGVDRFLSVSHSFSSDYTPEMKKSMIHLFLKGIHFGGQTFRFLAGEDGKSGGSASTYSSEGRDFGPLTFWFYATGNLVEDEEMTMRSRWMHEVFSDLGRVGIMTDFEEKNSAEHVRHWLGNFRDFSNTMKINTRLKLGFSTSYVAPLPIDDKRVVVIPDISFDGNLMTDGCGIISADLIQQFPFRVSKTIDGKRCGTMVSTQRTVLPAIIQVRLRCLHGLFKGCLLVSHDKSLFPNNSYVVLRESMKKTTVHRDKCLISELYIVDTFEVTTEEGKSDVNEMVCYANLNRQICLLLSHLGVPDDFFINLMKKEIDQIMSVRTSKERAWKIIKSEKWDYDEKSDNEYVTAENFFLAGHSLKEPKLQNLLLFIQKEGLAKLKSGRMRLKDSAFLVGAPDPYGILQEGEVYVQIYNRYLPSYASRDNTKVASALEGTIVVSRLPALHPGDVRMLTAVYKPELADFFKGSCGGVIIFSTKGTRSAGDEMGGGDFDGDRYLVLFGNNQFTNHIKQVEPYNYVALKNRAKEYVLAAAKPSSPLSKKTSPIAASPLTPPSQVELLVSPTAKTVPFDKEGQIIFNSLLAKYKASNVGRYNNAWLAYADKYGPHNNNAIKCFEIFCIAMDSPDVNYETKESLLKHPKPHYLEKQSSFLSKSVIGKLYDMVVAAEEGLGIDARVEQIILDPHLRVTTGSLVPASIATKYQDVWAGYVKNYRKRVAEFREIPARVKRNNAYRRIQREYKSYLDSHAAEVYNTHFLGKIAIVPLAKLLENNKSEDDRHCSLDFRMASYAYGLCRQFIACIVYEVAYTAGHNIGSQTEFTSLSSSIHMVWNLCQYELHSLKIQMMKNNGAKGFSDLKILPADISRIILS